MMTKKEDDERYISGVCDVGRTMCTVGMVSAQTTAATTADTDLLVMLDSDSDEHCAPQWYGASPLRPSCRQLVDVQGGWIERHGQRFVTIEVKDTSREGKPYVCVGDACIPIMVISKSLFLQCRLACRQVASADDVDVDGAADAARRNGGEGAVTAASGAAPPRVQEIQGRRGL